jgi:DNA-binding YbaB/EbfC family protein
MKGGLGQMLKQAQQMQENLQRAQEELASLEVTGSAGGGVVTVTLNGRYEARGVRIDDSFVGGDREMLEDLVSAAINDAVRKVEELSRERMAGLTAGLSLPPGLKLPF